ncbi:hypothetical protein GBA52_025859 [Prunus armeniaca]|nr:hypothetical protein GBA52_025859 [Prunus armeniaca]
MYNLTPNSVWGNGNGNGNAIGFLRAIFSYLPIAENSFFPFKTHHRQQQQHEREMETQKKNVVPRFLVEEEDDDPSKYS